MPTSAGLPKFFTRLSTPFRGSFALSRVNVGTKTPFEHYVFVNNPAVSHGQTVLGGVDAALLRALPSTDVRPRTPYRSCAVVGSSGAVLSYENGVSIDEHQMVLRFNDAPTKGFELYVGGKTTHRVCTGGGTRVHFGPPVHFTAPCTGPSVHFIGFVHSSVGPFHRYQSPRICKPLLTFIVSSRRTSLAPSTSDLYM